MRNSVRTLIIGSLLLFGVGLVTAGGDDPARDVVEKSIAAIGGEAKLAKYNAMTFTKTGTYYGMGDGLEFKGNYAVQWPGQFRMEIENVFTIVFDGDKGWIKGDGEVKEMSAEQLAVQKHDHRVGWMSSLLPLRDKAFALKALPDAKVDAMETRVVQASRKDYPDVTLYFDKATNYLVRLTYKTKSAEQNFKEVAMENNLSDYKEVDGVKVAHKMVLKRDGARFVESTVTSMKMEGKLDAKTFAMPK